MSSWKRYAAGAALCLIAGCTEEPFTPQVPPEHTISDAVHSNGKPHFYFLPPMVSSPSYGGTFDGTLSPTVQICEWSGNGCSAVLVTYTMSSGPGSETVRMSTADQQYIVNWHTDQFNLDAARTYRISIRVGDVELGFADVDVVNSGKDLKNVNTNEYIPLLDDRTLPIKFRVEQGFLARITVTPDPASVVVTQTKQFTAVASDLHGNVLNVPFAWTSSTAAATVDQNGLAVGVSDGATIITASAAGVSGSAALTVIGVARIDVIPVEVTLQPGRTQQYVAVLKDPRGDPVNGLTVVWASSDNNVATVDQNGLATAVADGSAQIRGTAAGVTGAATLMVQGGVVTSAAGYLHTCQLTATGKAYCWGWNAYGQLGISPSGDVASPVAVSGGHTFVRLASGYRFSCGLEADGSAWCWGFGGVGELGNGMFSSSSTPVLVAGGHAFRTLSAGYYNACGVTTAGAAYCWGEGFYGGIGDGSFTTRSSPTAVAGSHTFESLDVGGSHVCGLTTAHQLLCWGYDYQGQLGIGTFHQTGNMGVPTPTPVIGGHTFTSFSTTAHNTCGIDDSNAVYCWGYNAVGGVGIGHIGNDVNTPTPIIGGLSFKELFTGLSYHTCGRVVSGAIYCWGYNFAGQLGAGTTLNLLGPVAVAGGDDWATISTGLYHTCGVTTTGVGKCWGYNAFGQLGTGNFTNRTLPTLVAGGLTFATP